MTSEGVQPRKAQPVRNLLCVATLAVLVSACAR
jgi:hypothetical protein